MIRIAWALLLCLPALSAAQETRPLTEDVAAEIGAFYNQPTTIRLSGETRIPPGAELVGDVATVGGPLTVAGTIAGDVVVINGDLELRPEGRITGRVTVVGGRVGGATESLAGRAVVYPEALRFRREGDRLVDVGPRRESWLSAAWPTRFGRAEFTVAVDGAYNRVEGLPVAFGPRLELGRSNPTVIDARLIYRTRSGLRVHPDEFGHDLRIEQFLGGHRAVRVGVGFHRTIDPIELNGLSDTENSLTTFVLHRDYRDHYVRHGWRAYLGYGGRTLPLSAGLEYRDEDHGSAEARTPWSLLENDEPWRTQPQAAEGPLGTIRGWLTWDTRNDRDDPATGWLVEVESEQGLEGELRLRRYDPGLDRVETRPFGAEYTTLRVDARRYIRLGPRTRLALRAMAAGSPDDGALPPQRQHVLGGEGTLPGYDRFAFDCSAREAPLVDGFLPYYGCDRSVLLQAEARFSLASNGLGIGRRLGLDFDLVSSPELVVFADAGRAWIERESLGERLETGPSRLHYDLGAGIRLGRLGLYIAAPLSGDGGGPNFFIRLGPRL
ncbi:MAG: BamA/TamA family outer membrane protein [Gemmatimonadota bacterium]